MTTNAQIEEEEEEELPQKVITRCLKLDILIISIPSSKTVTLSPKGKKFWRAFCLLTDNSACTKPTIIRANKL